MKTALFVVLPVLFFSCASVRPYSCGPVLNQKTINETFSRILAFMGVKPGETFADLGASSGYYTVMMSTLLRDNIIYVQDIDTVCLNEREFNKVITYYSKQSGVDLRSQNDLRYIIGTPDGSNLPDNYFDHIYTNGTFHHFADRDKMVRDIYRKLKVGGEVTVRDSFTSKEEEYCMDATRVKLQPVDTLLAVMSRNGFRLLDRKDFAPYPAFKFGKK